MSRHVMLDIETLGLTPGSVILSIGAVVFDPSTGSLSSTFEAHIDPVECQEHGLSIDADTFLWWIKQSQEARDVLTRGFKISLPIALWDFDVWLSRQRTEAGGNLPIWSRGPSFDCALLSAAYRATGKRIPWHFRDERCVRTVLELGNVNMADYPATTTHSALADATAQAQAVMAAMANITRSAGTEKIV